MVSWTTISEAIAANHEKTFQVKGIAIPVRHGEIERFPITSSSATKPEVKEQPPIRRPLTPVSDDSLPPPPPVPAPKNTVKVTEAVTEKKLEKPTPVKAAGGLYEPRTLKQHVDPLVVGIDVRDPLYNGAPHHTRHQLEVEEAAFLEENLAELYKSQGGRSRGWTKSGLEIFIKPRCASGGNSKELDRVKAAFPWQLVAEDKAASAFLDFICVAKKIRIAVWDNDSKHVYLYPAADYVGPEIPTNFPLYHVTIKGELRSGFQSGTELVKLCDRDGWTLMPPLSIAHSLSGLTLAELESVGKKLGMANVDGSKAARVASVAVYKLRQRLLGAGSE